MNGRLLDNPSSELAMDNPVTLDNGLVLPVSPESGQDKPLIMLFEIPGVGSIWSPGGVLSDSARTALSAMLWIASEKVVESEVKL